MALPMALIIIVGEIDLSVEAMAGLASAILGVLWAAGVPLWIGIPIVLLVGAVGGVLNGTSGGACRAAIARRHARHAGPLPRACPGDHRAARRKRLPDRVHHPGLRQSARTVIPWPFVIFLAIALILGIVLHRTWVGRHIFAVGKNAGVSALLGRARPASQDRPLRPVRADRRPGGRDPDSRLSSSRADNAQGMTLVVVPSCCSVASTSSVVRAVSRAWCWRSSPWP